MIKYLTTWLTEADYNAFLASNECPYINVSHITATNENKYYKESSVLQNKPFTVHIDHLEGGALQFNFRTAEVKSGVTVPTYVRYKINNGEWKTFYYNEAGGVYVKENGNSVTLQQGDTLQIINKSNHFDSLFIWTETDADFNTLECTVSGNVMSLVWGDDFVYAPANKVPYPGVMTWPYSNDELRLGNFIESKRITDASNLWLPTRNLGKNIFNGMFSEYTILTAPPAINAKHLSYGACEGMFYGCTSLQTMPTILTETAEARAFKDMFNGCSALSTTTELHVKRIVPYISNPYDSYGLQTDTFQGMFYNCTSLTTAPTWNQPSIIVEKIEGFEAPAYTFNSMFYGCSSLVDASTIKLNLNAWVYTRDQWCGNMFAWCSSIEKSPVFGLVADGGSNTAIKLDSNTYEDCSNTLDTIYSSYSGELTVQNDQQLNNVAASGTVYVPADSEYLPGGSRENEKPFNLNDWTVSAIV